MPDEPFDLTGVLPFLAGTGPRALIRRGLEAALGLELVRARFRKAAAQEGEPFATALGAFGLRVEIPDFTAALPADGPAMVLANHPFGGADALALGALCRERRPDTLLLANRMAAAIPGLSRHMLPLSILGEDAASRDNARSLRTALAHLRAGGCLAAFPSGEVAHRRGAGITESPWSPHLASLAMRTEATVVLVAFSGRNPWWFHRPGTLHPLVRTALLPRVLLSMQGDPVHGSARRLDPADHRGEAPEILAERWRQWTEQAASP